MTYRREVEKAIKGYLYPLGYKYKPKKYYCCPLKVEKRKIMCPQCR